MAPRKTKFIMVNRKHISSDFSLRILDNLIKPSEEMKYLGIYLNKYNNFFGHIDKSVEKASRVIMYIARITMNIGGPTEGGRLLLYNILESIIGYACPIWCDRALLYRRNLVKLESIQRLGLIRVARSYRTVSGLALSVITGVLPLDIKLKERRIIYYIKKRYSLLDDATADEDTVNEEIRLVKNELINEWQNRWSNFRKAAWTKICIPDILPWTTRRWGRLNFRLTQALTGHGVFNSYRQRIGKSLTDACWFCDDDIRDDPEHTLFRCDRWLGERHMLEMDIGVIITAETWIELMLRDPITWDKINKYVNDIILYKEKLERKIERGRITLSYDYNFLVIQINQ